MAGKGWGYVFIYFIQLRNFNVKMSLFTCLENKYYKAVHQSPRYDIVNTFERIQVRGFKQLMVLSSLASSKTKFN